MTQKGGGGVFMKRSKTLAGVLLLTPLLTVAAGAAAQQLKIGYVDLQRALNESEAGKKAKERFKVQVDKLQGDLKKQKDQLDSMKDQLEKKASVMKPDEARNLQKDYERKLRDFERNYKDSQGELQQKDNELTVELLKELQGVIEEFGKEGGYSIILEQSSSSVLYGAPDLDLTDQVIARYNARKSK
jgi:outer membrane protein